MRRYLGGRRRALAIVAGLLAVTATVAAVEHQRAPKPLSVQASGPPGPTVTEPETTTTGLLPTTTAGLLPVATTLLKPPVGSQPTPPPPPTIPTPVVPRKPATVERTGMYIVSRDGSALTRVGDSGDAPSWSPDGRQVAYTCGADSNRICLARTDGTDMRELARNAAHPAFHPDGVRLAYFVFNTSGGEDLVIGGTDGRKPKTVTTHAWRSFGWSSDGRLAYTTFENAAGAMPVLHILELDGSSRTLVDRVVDEFGAEWSPDDRFILTANEGIQAVRTDGSGSTKVRPTAWGGHLGEPQQWAPDSRSIVANYTDAVAYRGVAISTLDGVLRIITGQDETNGVWSPDGSTIAVSHIGGPYGMRVRLDFVDPKTGIARVGFDPGPKWAVWAPQWSPSGDRLAVSVVENKASG